MFLKSNFVFNFLCLFLLLLNCSEDSLRIWGNNVIKHIQCMFLMIWKYLATLKIILERVQEASFQTLSYVFLYYN